MKIRHSRYFALCIGVIVFLIDLLTKYQVQSFIPKMNHIHQVYPYGGYGVFENFLGIEFSIVHHTNRGAAWGVLSNWQQPLLYFRIVLVLGLLTYVLFFNKRKEWEIPFALIIAGATGNILDYFMYGHVIDMLHFNFWGYNYPVFNVADSAIFIGIVWILISSWKK